MNHRTTRCTTHGPAAPAKGLAKGTWGERRRKNAGVGAGLKSVLGPHVAADVLSAAAVTALVDARGKDTAVTYLRDLALELEADETIERETVQ